MTVVIRFTAKQESKALPILLRHSPGMILQNRTYIVSEAAVRRLRQERIKFTEISREGAVPTTGGALSGERI